MKMPKIIAFPSQKSLQILIIIFFFSFIPIHSNHVQSETNSTYIDEKTILLRLKDFSRWNRSSVQYWNSSSNHCSWPGIFCTNGSVTGINIQRAENFDIIRLLLCQLKNLMSIELQFNLISGPFPTFLHNCSKLKHLDLSRNSFDGTIPEDIDRTLPSHLEYLDLSYNNFSGALPAAIALLSNLTYLDLSGNKFSGKIPPEIQRLSSLKYLDLSSNNFSDFDIYGFAPSLSIVVLAVVLTIFYLFCILLCIYKRYKLDSTWNLVPFQKLNFTGETIVSSLTENNLIGCGASGSVYRVEINTSSGEYVAVKKIHYHEELDKRFEKQFRSEVQILGTIRHLNIVRLMCYISSQNSKLLVYKYMENGSLDQWLHSSVNVVLEWPNRLKIAIAIADGLCYMHHYSSSPIIHRDLKPSNILLDSEFNAKIADFGLAKILENDGVSTTMSVVAGTFGYIAPEYAQTARVTEKVDVYSFGVILLELVTGRRAHQGDVNSSLVEWAWNHIQQENEIVDAFDEKIKEPNHLDEMIKVFKLGICCTNALPSRRPNMSEVVQILHRCAHPLAASGHNLIPELNESVPQTSKLLFLFQNLIRFRVYRLSNRST